VINSHDNLRYYLRDLLATLHHSSRPVYHNSLCYSLFFYLQVGGITNQNIMAKKVFLRRERAIPTAETPSVNRTDIPSAS